jgi:hypothetical protein
MTRGESLTTYQSNRTETHQLALESSPLYEPVAELAQEGFSGTVTELHARLTCMISESIGRSVRWPKACSRGGEGCFGRSKNAIYSRR